MDSNIITLTQPNLIKVLMMLSKIQPAFAQEI